MVHDGKHALDMRSEALTSLYSSLT